MVATKLHDDFYERIKPRLYQRIGRELRLAYRVLDLGCGACELAQYLSRAYGQKVTGVDICADGFPKPTKRAQRIRCICKDAARLTFIQNEAIDAVILFWALHEMKNVPAILREAHRVLRPGGKVLVVEFPRNSLASTLWNENYFARKALTGFLRKAGFKNIQAERIEQKQVLWVTGFRSKNTSL